MDLGKKFASIFATAAVLGAFGTHAADLEAVASAPSVHNVEITSVVRDEIGLRCDTCVNAEALYAEAQSRFGTAVNTKVYAVNAATGTIVGVFINYLGPTEPPTIRRFAIDPLLERWVAQVGEVYRANGNSLRLRLVARADGSMYWVRANGTIEELKGRDTRLNGIGAPMTNSLGPQVNDAPPNSAPIDLRGYQFPSNFFQNYPNFPRTTYDFAFTTSQNVNGFLHDQTAGIQYGTPSGIINGTVSQTANGGVTTPVASVVGGVTVTNNLTSTITVYVPMKDGGFALMSYDKKTGVITLLQLEDGQGATMPTNHPSPQSYLAGSPFNFNNTGPGVGAYGAFYDWALRNGIPVVGPSQMPAGGLSCTFTPGANNLTCKRPF